MSGLIPILIFGAVIVGALVYQFVIKKEKEKPRPNLDWGCMMGFSQVVGLDLPSYKYLKQIRELGGNFTRIWLWDVWNMKHDSVEHTEFLPYKKVGNKFDLTQWNPLFWNKLKQFIEEARQNGIIVLLTLFPGAQMKYGDLFHGHPYNADFNLQNWFSNRNSWELFNTRNSTAIRVEQALIQKVIDTVGSYDNIIYEYSNEADKAGTDWLRFMRNELETKHGKIHRTCMSGSRDGYAGFYAIHNVNSPRELGNRGHYIYSSDGSRRAECMPELKALWNACKDQKKHMEWYFERIVNADGSLDQEVVNIIKS